MLDFGLICDTKLIMWNKVYLLAAAVTALVMAVLVYFAYNELQTIGFAPKTVVENFQYYESMYHQFLWMSSLILLILGNVVLWKMRKSWALWTTLLYFAAFVLLDTWWLGGLFSEYKKSNFPAGESFSFTGIVGAILCVAAALVIFFNQFIVQRMRDRVSSAPPSPASAAPVSDTVSPTENK